MSVCTYACEYGDVWVWKCVCIYICRWDIHVSEYRHVCECVTMYVNVCDYMHMCISVGIWVWTYMFVCAWVGCTAVCLMYVSTDVWYVWACLYEHMRVCMLQVCVWAQNGTHSLCAHHSAIIHELEQKGTDVAKCPLCVSPRLTTWPPSAPVGT